MRFLAKYALAFLLFTFHLFQGQIINTVAGTGVGGYSGDGGPAIAAALKFPMGVACDGNGNLYIADNENERIRKVTPSGFISTVAGNGTLGFSGDGGPAVNASFRAPNGICIDSQGNMYMADLGNNRIRKINTSGTITTIAGTGTAGYSGDGGPALSAQLNNPFAVKVDINGNMYIADYFNHCIRKINPSGIITTIAGTGAAGYGGDNGPAVSAKLSNPNDMAIDPQGNIYITDEGNNRIRMVNPAGIISTIAGTGNPSYSGDGGLAVNAELFYPMGITLDGAANVYFGDQGNGRVRKVSVSGIITTIAGNGAVGCTGDGGPATAAAVNGESSLCFDPAGNLYITDNGDNRIRMITNVYGIEEFKDNNSPLIVFPNPSTGQIVIVNKERIDEFKVFDSFGRLVYNGESAKEKISLQIIDPGIYSIVVNSKGKIQRTKLIVEK